MNTPTCCDVVSFSENGKENFCEQPATHAYVNVRDNVIIYKCDRHRYMNQVFIPYLTKVSLEEAILIEVFDG